MIQRLIHHLRGNAVAYVALFVALGGTSYAAVSLPRNSVGTKQLRNGAVTPAKVTSSVGEQVWAVTVVDPNGVVHMSNPEGAKVRGWRVGSPFTGGVIVYPHRYPKGCAAVATAVFPDSAPDGEPSVTAGTESLDAVYIASDSSTSPITVTVLCPR